MRTSGIIKFRKNKLTSRKLEDPSNLYNKKFVNTWPSYQYVLVEHPILSTVIICSTLLRRLSNRFWSVAVGMCVHSTVKALMRFGIMGVRRPGGFNQKKFSEVEVRALYRSVKFFHSKLGKSQTSPLSCWNTFGFIWHSHHLADSFLQLSSWGIAQGPNSGTMVVPRFELTTFQSFGQCLNHLSYSSLLEILKATKFKDILGHGMLHTVVSTVWRRGTSLSP